MSKKDKKGGQTPHSQRKPYVVIQPPKPEQIWILEPHDPVIFRDGRPFGPDPSARAASLPFPFPSTTTGGARSRAGLKADGMFDKSQIDRVKQIKVRGPLLMQLAQSGDKIERWLVPTPADALLLESKTKDHLLCKRLVPLKLYEKAETSSTFDNKPLMWVGPVQSVSNKPSKDAPSYWYWDQFEEWLLNPADHEPALTALGQSGPIQENRLHVSMNPETLTAKEGALFETSGLEFTSPGSKYEERLSGAKRLALAVVVDKAEASTIRSGLASLGGERRMVIWRKSKSDSELPKLECPPEILTAIGKNGACRVLLLTPAYFVEGYRPTWLLKKRDGVTPQLKAIAIQRPQVVSGWDLEKGEPKSSRRLAPAGTVLFLSLTEEGKPIDEKAIQDWVKSIWMHCISDDLQAQNDGFGLAVLGSWSGQPEEMQ